MTTSVYIIAHMAPTKNTVYTTFTSRLRYLVKSACIAITTLLSGTKLQQKLTRLSLCFSFFLLFHTSNQHNVCCR